MCADGDPEAGMGGPTVDELVLVDVDLERVPACVGFVDPDGKVPCPKPAEYVVRLVHRRDNATCGTALACDTHARAQLDVQRRVEAIPHYLPICLLHHLPIDTKAVPL